MSLVEELIKDLLPEQEKKKIVAVYGGGFKPPTKGHFEVVKRAIEENPEIDEFIINIGGKERDGVTPEEAIQIWDIYKQYLPISANINIKYSNTPPIKATYDYAKNNPNEDVLFILGAREGNEDDFKDISKRTTKLGNYPNLELRTIITQGGASGTAARQAGKISKEKLLPYLPDELKDEEVEEVYRMVSDKVTEGRKPKKDPKKGTGKKPKGTGRRLYTDEDPKDTVGIKFSTRQDIVDTLNKKSFKAKSHARQSQIINLIHQRTRAAYNRAKDSKVKKRLKTALDYITKRKEASKKKTQRLKKENKYLNEARFKNLLTEQWQDHKAHVINHFTDYATNYLSIDRPKIKIITDPQYTQMHHSFGGYMPSTSNISVVVHNRNMADILRTLAHELVHHMQNLDDRLTDNSGDDGSPEENEANALAAVIMRQYGRENSHIYE